MKLFKLKGILIAATVALASAGVPSIASAQEILRSDTDAQGGPGHTLIVVASKIWRRELDGLSVQVNDSQTLTRSALKLGSGKLEVMPLPTTVATFLQKGERMYKKDFKEEAIAASKKIGGIMGWLAVTSHAIVWADSGIEGWPDVKGKRIYLGPPSGGASINSETSIRLFTGYEPNEDYEALKMPWGSGMQAMLDGKIDVFFRPSGLGSATIEQLGLKKQFRILDARTGDPEGYAEFLKPPHRFEVEIPPGTYSSQVDNDKSVFTTGGTFNLAVSSELSDDMVYGMTKAIWENLAEMQQTAVTLKSIDPERPFIGANVRLHPGAARYYNEVGIEIPERLMPL
ncbi:MAG: TAXI family TRAP transporter solute-binding subunit [Gammaproteobacteria bacterium]|nr:TAXI family TRAP transporter solute-binding subunit [Gammaproteobacteria bacterium]